jgi:2-methylisocitrate lyase-like PEP mutase family enzyme
MGIDGQRAKAEAFLRLHLGPRLLILPNVWDVGSARIVEQAGFHAVATTSAGIAYSLGYRDGQRISRGEMIAAVGRITRAVRIPVTADLEAGYGDTPAAAAVTARAALAVGAVGLNLEDGTGEPAEPLVELGRQLDKLRAVQEAAASAGVPLVLNARTDTYLAEVGDPEGRLDETIRRVRAFREAGATCVFVPRLVEPDAIAALLKASPGPLNLLAGPGLPTVPVLDALGVARLSMGAGLYRAALGVVRRIASEWLTEGASPTLAEMALASAEAERLLEDRPDV